MSPWCVGSAREWSSDRSRFESLSLHFIISRQTKPNNKIRRGIPLAHIKIISRGEIQVQLKKGFVWRCRFFGRNWSIFLRFYTGSSRHRHRRLRIRCRMRILFLLFVSHQFSSTIGFPFSRKVDTVNLYQLVRCLDR